MSGGNRLSYVALGGCLAAFLWTSASLGQEPQEVVPTALESQPETEGGQTTSEQRAADQGQKNEPAPENLSPSLDKIEAAIRDLIAQERAAQGQGPKNEEIRDLKAQEGMAFWAKLIFWATIAAVLLTFAGIYLIWRTLKYTKIAAGHTEKMLTKARETTKAARAAVDVARQAERAWLKVDAELLDNIEFDKRGDASFRIKFMAKNIGNSPAFAVDVHAKVYLYASHWDWPHVAQLKYADIVREVHENDRGAIVFPGDDWKRTLDLKIWSSDAKRAREQAKAIDGTDDGYLRALVIGCVQYLTRPDDKRPSQSGFLYAILVRREGESPGWVLDGKSSSRKDVVLEKRFLDPRAVT